jgi:hypothetical protein
MCRNESAPPHPLGGHRLRIDSWPDIASVVAVAVFDFIRVVPLTTLLLRCSQRVPYMWNTLVTKKQIYMWWRRWMAMPILRLVDQFLGNPLILLFLMRPTRTECCSDPLDS